MIPRFRNYFVALLFSLTAISLYAQALKTQPTPFTAWVDFRALADPAAPRPALPIWLDHVATFTTAPGDVAAKTVYRIYFRPMPGINDAMSLRLFFNDKPDEQPVLTAWTADGTCRFGPKPFGAATALPNSETVEIPMTEIDHIDIVVSGNGSSIRGALLSSLTTISIRQPLDFSSATSALDPFSAPRANSLTTNGDSYLLGRVRASLATDVVELSNLAGNENGFAFSLQKAPQLAVITFEVLDPNVDAPPKISANGHPLGAANMQLPDLADPGYESTSDTAGDTPEFHYTGWLRCQKVIFGAFLLQGENKIFLQNGDSEESVAVRNVQIQLKYPPTHH